MEIPNCNQPSKAGVISCYQHFAFFVPFVFFVDKGFF